ncbi:MAG: hypothetical protein MUO42_01875 [Anaerolineaceae bacterium]|jgi:hypothetical protein|nr:hypothetical protein [Anaerolineaceae bacterium]
MFKFGKGKDDDDPKKALDKANNVLNKGLMGGITKAFMGKDFVDKANSGINMANQALDGQALAQQLAQTGADATAEVVSIQDTGATVNMNPVVVLVLKVKPAAGDEFQTAGQMTISRLAIPRAGDKIKIKYNPENNTQFVIV